MQVNVVNRLTALVAGIDHQPEAVIGQALFPCYMLAGQQQFAHKRFIVGPGITHTAQVLAGNNQYMCGRRRVNIVKCIDMIIAVHFL